MKKYLYLILVLVFTNISYSKERMIFKVTENTTGHRCHDSKYFVLSLIDSDQDSKYEAMDLQGAQPAIDLDGNNIVVAYYATPEPKRVKVNEQSSSSQGELILTNYKQTPFTDVDFEGESSDMVRNEKLVITLSADKKTVRYREGWDDYAPGTVYVRHFDIWLKETTPHNFSDCTYSILE